MLTFLQEIPAWLSVLVAASGAVVSGLNLGRSRWAPLLLGGFLAETVALVFSRVAVLGLRSGAVAAASLGVGFLAASVLGLVGKGAVVAGLAGVLSDSAKARP